MLPSLPVSNSSFSTLRTAGQVYVDKTELIYKMAREINSAYFLSHPRRFGKSLLVSTLDALFQGKRELFEGLWIDREGDWEWESHPVIVLDFNGITSETPEALETNLLSRINGRAEEFEITLKEEGLGLRFHELIVKCSKKFENKTVVLVDEYDKPILNFLGKGDEAVKMAHRNRAILKRLFGTLKGKDVQEQLRFVFFTGITRFGKVSIFSDLNQLKDVSNSSEYAGLLGYTHEELTEYFSPHIDAFCEKIDKSKEDVIETLRRQYNGYRFSKNPLQVYNPFSILLALQDCEFGSYWFDSGTPTYLTDLFAASPLRPEQLESFKIPERLANTFDIENLDMAALLFQSGYLTIHDVHDRALTLGYPNEEVKGAFLELLYGSLTNRQAMSGLVTAFDLADHLAVEDLDAFMEGVDAVFASIPQVLGEKLNEANFHTLFYVVASLTGMIATSEILSSQGRTDLAIEFPDKVYVIEFKCGRSPQKALQQIREKGYMDRWAGTGRKRIAIGINFSAAKRMVQSWKAESY